jgi:OOP family OmpA-OmpF porin
MNDRHGGSGPRLGAVQPRLQPLNASRASATSSSTPSSAGSARSTGPSASRSPAGGHPHRPIGTQRASRASRACGCGPRSPSSAASRRAFRLAATSGRASPSATTGRRSPRGDSVRVAISYGPSLTFGVGASYRLGNVIDLMAEVYGAQYLNGFSNALATTPMEGILGAKIFVDRNSYLTLGGGAGIHAGDRLGGLPRLRGLHLRAQHRRHRRRRLPRRRRPLPLNEPEDFDNFEDEDGCPEPDNDRDGILDVDDQCPLVPEDRNGQQDSDGCPDSDVQDRDGDQIADNVDRCPDDPEDRDGFEDENGCPDPDNDQDQILDTDDLCPNEPEDRDGFEDDNGCPDPDNDQDGIPTTTTAPPTSCPQRARGLQRPRRRRRLPRQRPHPPRGRRSSSSTSRSSSRPTARRSSTTSSTARSSSRWRSSSRGRPTSAGRGRGPHRRARPRRPQPPALPRPRQQRDAGAGGAGRRRGSPRAAGYGEYCPVDPRSNEEAWARNRRVQFKIIRVAGNRTAPPPAAPAAVSTSPRPSARPRSSAPLPLYKSPALR